jgi:hypothetical protein
MPTCGSGASPRPGVFQDRLWKELHRAATGRDGGSAGGVGAIPDSGGAPTEGLRSLTPRILWVQSRHRGRACKLQSLDRRLNRLRGNS